MGNLLLNAIPPQKAATVANSKCLNFNGTTQTGSVANATSLQATSGLTLMAWVKAPPGSNGGNEEFFAKANAVSSPTVTGFSWALEKSRTGTSGFELQLTQNGNIANGLLGLTYDITSNSGTAFDNTWHHVCLTLSFSLTDPIANMYIDGNPVTFTVIANNHPTSIFVDNSTVTIGARTFNGVPFSFYTGKLDEPAMWKNIALPAAAVKQIYRAYASGVAMDLTKNFNSYQQASSLVLWLRDGDNPSDTNVLCKDNSGLGNDCTLSNIAAYTNDAPP